MTPILEQAATLADNAAGLLHSAAVQPTPAADLARCLVDLQRAAEIVAGVLPAPAPEVATTAAKKRGKR